MAVVCSLSDDRPQCWRATWGQSDVRSGEGGTEPFYDKTEHS